jgi:hypothetical protein
MKYEKPLVVCVDDVSEGVYAASGEKCDSIYMNGVWQGADYSMGSVSGVTYRQLYGCEGCRAYRKNGCGLLLDYVESGYAPSYGSDGGFRKPEWEAQGHAADEKVSW